MMRSSRSTCMETALITTPPRCPKIVSAVDPYAPAVYAKAAENLAHMIQAGVLMRDAKPCYYVYRLSARDPRDGTRQLQQTGLAAVGSVADYAINRIRKHEHTTPVKE